MYAIVKASPESIPFQLSFSPTVAILLKAFDRHPARSMDASAIIFEVACVIGFLLVLLGVPNYFMQRDYL